MQENEKHKPRNRLSRKPPLGRKLNSDVRSLRQQIKKEIEFGLTSSSARKRLIEQVMETVEQKTSTQVQTRSTYQRFIVPTLIFCACCRTSAVIFFQRHFLVEVIEILILVSSALLHFSFSFIKKQRQDLEIIERIQFSLQSIYTQQQEYDVYAKTSSSGAASPERVQLQPSTSYVAVYRDGNWQRSPMNMLVEGDIIALMSGDIAPDDIELVSSAEIEGSAASDASRIHLTRGSIIPTSSEEEENFIRCKATFEPHLLFSLCGGMRIFRMKGTPVLHDVNNSLEKIQKRPKTLLRKQCDQINILISKWGIGFTCVLMLILIYRTWLYQPAFEFVLESFVSLPVNVILCFLPVSAPVILMIFEAAATARLMSVFEVVIRRNEENQAKSPATAVDEDGDDTEFDDFDVEEREIHRSTESYRFALSRSWKYFITTLQYRLKPCKDAHRASGSKISEHLLHPIPYLSTKILERLGAVTMVCCVDDDVLCEPSPSVEEIFLLKDAESATAVLDLHHDTNCDTKLKFENPRWRQYLPSLKPIGLNILLNGTNYNRSQYEAELAYLSSEFHSTDQTGINIRARSRTQKCIQDLAAHIRQLPPPEYLLNLSKEIGFCEDDLSCFLKKKIIHVVAPRLAHAEHTSDKHAQGQQEARFRGNLKSHLVSTIILDKRSNGHQLLSRGHPALAVDKCPQYWNGKSICAMTASRRQAILDVYHQWVVEDLDCIALTYAPIPQSFNVLFDSQDLEVSMAPVYLVENSEAGHMPLQQAQSTVDSELECNTPISACSQGLKSPELALDSPSTASGTFDSEEEQDPVDDTEMNATEEMLWNLQENQIFLGMVASGVQPNKGVSGFIEDLTAAGIRFVYFSPRNMRRSKPLAEKMGIETDWNCAISLRALDSNEPDPYRMTSNYSDWDVKARLPHGIQAIRRHLDEVDNVPLLVSLFTDSTTTTIDQMLQIFQENEEVVLCVGNSLNDCNAPLFSRADLAIAMEGKAATFFDESIPNGTNCTMLNESDITLSRILNTISCALSITTRDETTPNLNSIVDLIRLGREMLTNYRQQLMFASTAQVFVAWVILIGQMVPLPQSSRLSSLSVVWFLWIVVPAMSLTIIATPSDAKIMQRTPPKNENEIERPKILRLVQLLAVRFVPSAFMCVMVFQVSLAISMCFQEGEVQDHPSPAFEASWRHYTGNAALYTTYPPKKHVREALNHAEAVMMVYMLICLCTISSGMLHRAESIFIESPFRNRNWVFTSLALLVLQAIMTLWRLNVFATYTTTGLFQMWNFFFSGRIPWYVYAVFCAWPFIAIGIDELAKIPDRRHLERFHKFMRMQFDTRLGMWSPR